MTNFVSPTGYVDLDNDCQYSIDVKSTRSRESVDPKTDLAFYFNTYIEPKYGLGNINVSNCASFMKDLEMNWTKLDPGLKNKVMDIMVDYIFVSGNFDFKKAFLAKLGINEQVQQVKENKVKDSFGKTDDPNLFMIASFIVLFGVILVILDKTFKGKVNNFSKLY
jgi:hypothetical protein